MRALTPCSEAHVSAQSRVESVYMWTSNGSVSVRSHRLDTAIERTYLDIGDMLSGSVIRNRRLTLTPWKAAPGAVSATVPSGAPPCRPAAWRDRHSELKV